MLKGDGVVLLAGKLDAIFGRPEARWRTRPPRAIPPTAVRSGRCVDWIKVKNPEAPAAARVIER